MQLLWMNECFIRIWRSKIKGWYIFLVEFIKHLAETSFSSCPNIPRGSSCFAVLVKDLEDLEKPKIWTSIQFSSLLPVFKREKNITSPLKVVNTLLTAMFLSLLQDAKFPRNSGHSSPPVFRKFLSEVLCDLALGLTDVLMSLMKL